MGPKRCDPMSEKVAPLWPPAVHFRHPHQQTSSGSVGMSQTCQQRAHARQQLVAITSSGYNKSASFRLGADSYFLRGSSAGLT